MGRIGTIMLEPEREVTGDEVAVWHPREQSLDAVSAETAIIFLRGRCTVRTLKKLFARCPQLYLVSFPKLTPRDVAVFPRLFAKHGVGIAVRGECSEPPLHVAPEETSPAEASHHIMSVPFFRDPDEWEDERALIQAVQAGNPAAIEALVQREIRYIVRLANKTAGSYHDAVVDLVQEGLLALLDTAKRFDFERNARFMAFAQPRIAGAMRDFLRRTQPFVRQRARAERKWAALAQELQREPTEKEVAGALSCEVATLRRYQQIAMSLERVIFQQDDAPVTLESALRSSSAGPEESVMDSETYQLLRKGMEILTDRERVVLTLCCGLDGQRPLAGPEIGEILGVTESRVSQIKTRAVERLRSWIDQQENEEPCRVSTGALVGA